MKDSTQLAQFLADYKEYVTNVLNPTRKELKVILRRWREPGYWSKYTKKRRLPDPSPVQRAFVRIKRPESVVDKIMRKPTDYPSGLSPDSFRCMNDAIGARAIVYFMSHLPLIDLDLRNHEGLEISEDVQPVAYLNESLTKRLSLTHLRRADKESGYASIHYLVRLRKSFIPRQEQPWCELQVRTLAEDLWGEIEHVLGYKPNKKTSFAVRKQFQILSGELTLIDDHFNFLHEELMRFQEEVTYEDADPLNAENLPPVLSEMGIGCAQQEIDSLLKLMCSRGINTVGDLRRIGTPGRLEIIRNTYRSEKGRAPINFEMIANLATLNGSEDGEEQIKLVKAQIEYLEAWDMLKKGFAREDTSSTTT